MGTTKTKVPFCDIADLMMYSNKQVLVVYEEELTKNHTFAEVIDMWSKGAEFYVVDETDQEADNTEPEKKAEDTNEEEGLPFVDVPEQEKSDNKYPAKKRGKLSNENINVIGVLASRGWDVTEIASHLNVGEGTVLKYLNKFESGELEVDLS